MTGVQSGEPNFHWLMRVWWADLREAWRRVARRLVGWALRQGRLVEEELLAGAVENSSGDIQWEAMVVQVQA